MRRTLARLTTASPWCLSSRMGARSSVTGSLLHDYFAMKGGGERLVLTLAEALDWPVVGGFVAEACRADPDWPLHRVRGLGVPPGTGAMQIPRLIRAWRNYSGGTPQPEVVLFSGAYAPLAAPNFTHSRKVFYCHTPPRFVYDQAAFYQSRLPWWQRLLALPMLRRYRRLYEAAVAEMDVIIANSENVRGRLRRYLGRDAVVVHPPCDTDRFKWRGQGDYYLSVARLDPMKRVDGIVRAFTAMPGKRLIVTSGGPELARLQRMAAGAANIEFTSWVDEARLADLIGNAIATLYLPVDEDFGMSPVESMAAGKPVVGVAEGGMLETVVDGDTGILLPPGFTTEQLVETVATLTPSRAAQMREACERRAETFRAERFVAEMQAILGSS